MSGLKTCFKRVDYDLAALLHYLDIGDIGLSDKWPKFSTSVRALFFAPVGFRGGADE